MKEKRAKAHISIKLLVMNLDSLLLDTFSNELEFVANNVSIFMILFLATTYFRHYMLYSVTKRFIVVAEFCLAPTFFAWHLSSY